MPDGQLVSSLKELVSADLASELNSREATNTTMSELREALAVPASSDETVAVADSLKPMVSWRQLARCNSGLMAENLLLAKSALAQEREAGQRSLAQVAGLL